MYVPLAGGRERGPPSLFELRRGLAVALAEADAPLRAAGPSPVTSALWPEHEVGLFADLRGQDPPSALYISLTHSRARRHQPVDSTSLSIYYLLMADIDTRALDRELKKGSAELLILSLLEARPRHGYELSKLIHTRSDGQLTFHIDSLYPLLYRLEERGWIKGTWVEKEGERRRRFYKVTAEGRRVLARQRKTWETFVESVRRITGGEHA